MAVSSLLLLSGCSGGGSISSLDSILSSSSSSSAASSESSGSSSSSGTSSSSSSSSASSSGSSSSASSGSSESSSSESSIHTHVYGNTYTITVQPTLTTTGKATHKCESDDAIQEVEVPALSDTAVWTKTTVKEPTHTEDGEDDYSSVYGTVKVTIAKKSDEHVYGTEYTITTEPTLTSAGKATRKCESDDATEEVEIPALSDASVWTKTTVKEPTHTEDGTDKYTSIYGTVEVATAKKSDEHVYGNTYTITVNPTLTTAGKATRKCESDDATEEVEIPALSDASVWTKTTVKEATDTEEGTYKYTSIYGTLQITHKHTGSNKYTTSKKDDGTVKIYESCALNDGGIVGDVVNTMTAKAAAEYDIDFTNIANPWTQDGTDSKTWTSAKIGASSSTWMNLKITKGGWIKISYKVSSEKGYDKLNIKNGSTVIGTFSGVEGTDDYITGAVEFEVKENDCVSISYSKDGGGDKGKDQAIITLEDSTFNYSATNYVTNGGTAVTPSFIENGKIVGDLPTPTKDGCYFEGWYIDEGLETPYDASTANLVGDASLYAKWSDALYVTLHTGDTTSERVSFQNGTTPTLPADPTRDGYYFIGWYTDSAYSTAYESKAATASFDLYAKWVSVAEAGPLYGSYKGFYVGNSSSSTTTSYNYAEVEVDATKTLTLRTYYSGYAHGTVEVNEDGTVNVTSTESIKSVYVDDSTLIVAYTYSSSTTRYYFVSKENETCSSTGVSAVSVNNGKDLFVSYSVGDTAKTAYIDQNGTVYTGVSFVDGDGEAVAVSDLKSKLTFFVKKDGDTIASFYATQSSGTYSLTNDGVAGSYTCSDGETLVLSGGGKALFSKIGSSGKPDEANYRVEKDGTIYVYYASIYRYLITLSGNSFTYEVRNVTVTLDYGYAETEGEGNKTDTYTQLYDKWSYIPSDKSSPTRDGYTFDGWYTSSDYSGNKATGGSYTEDKTLYAKWIENYTVSYKEVDGTTDVSGCESTEITGGKKLSSLPTPTAKEGYDFDGWYLDKECTKAFDISTPINEDTTLYAHWTTPLTITKYLNNVDGEETPTTQSAQYNRAPTIETPTKEGYVFAGWYTDKDLTQPFDATAPLTTNVTLYAKYEVESEFKGSYYGYNCYSYYNGKSNKFSSTTLSVDGYGETSGRFDWTIKEIDKSTGKITFTRNSQDAYGWYLKADDGRIFIITGCNAPSSKITTDLYFMVLNTDSSEALSYSQTQSGDVYTIVVSVNGTATYTVNIDTKGQTFTFASATA